MTDTNDTPAGKGDTMTNHYGERTKERIAGIVAWYDIARQKALDDLDSHRAELLLAERARCVHEMLPWVQVDQEMYMGWRTDFRRHCKWCGLPENQEGCPAGLNYTPSTKMLHGIP